MKQKKLHNQPKPKEPDFQVVFTYVYAEGQNESKEVMDCLKSPCILCNKPVIYGENRWKVITGFIIGNKDAVFLPLHYDCQLDVYNKQVNLFLRKLAYQYLIDKKLSNP